MAPKKLELDLGSKTIEVMQCVEVLRGVDRNGRGILDSHHGLIVLCCGNKCFGVLILGSASGVGP